MSIFKECQNIMLPTKDLGVLIHKAYDNPKHLWLTKVDKNEDDKIWQPQHLYTLVDGEINNGDWYYWKVTRTVQKFKSTPNDNGRTPTNSDGSFKIIATSNKLLGWTNIGQDESGNTIGNHISKGNGCLMNKPDLPQQPESFIQEYCGKGGINKVLVEFDYVIHPDINNWMDAVGRGTLKPQISSDNTITIKPIKDNWSREELIELAKNENISFKKWVKNNLY